MEGNASGVQQRGRGNQGCWDFSYENFENLGLWIWAKMGLNKGYNNNSKLDGDENQ